MRSKCYPDSSRLSPGILRRPRFKAAGLRLLLGAALVWSGASYADLITLTNTDGTLNTSSFVGGMAVTNWSNGQPPAPGNDYLVPSGRTLRSPTNGLPASAYIFAGDSLTLGGTSSGASQLSLKATNLITVNNLILTNGTVFNGDPGGTLNSNGLKVAQLAGNINIITNGWIQGGESNRLLMVSAALSGSGNLTMNGRGFVTLSGTHSYNGPLTISASTVEMDRTVSLHPSALILGKDSSLFGVSNYVTVTNSGVVSNYVVWVTNVFNSTNIVRPGGNLNVGYGPGGDLRVGWRTTADTNNNVVALFDASSQAQFSANVGNFIVGQSTGSSSSTRASAAGLVYLATNNSIVVATNVIIADTVEAVSTVNSLVKLGSGSNYIDAPLVVVGARKQNATLSLPAGGSLVLTNSAGRMNLTVGGNDAGTSGSSVNSADLSGGPVVATLDTLVVGRKTLGGVGGATGTLTLATNAANYVDVNTVWLGWMANDDYGAAGVARGTLNLNGGTFHINGGLNFAYYDLAGSGYVAGSSAGVLNLNAGRLEVAGDIGNGQGGSSTLNINGGIMDLQPAGDGAPGNVLVDNLLVNGIVTNAGNITATSLVVNGTVTNAGFVNATSLVLNGTIGRVGDISAQSLSGSGSILSQTGTTTVSSLLEPGTSNTVGTLKLGSLTLNNINTGVTLRMTLTNDLTPGNGVNDLLDITGDLSFGNNVSLVIQEVGNGLIPGTYRLANYTGEFLGNLSLPTTIGRYTLSLATDTTTMPRHLNLVVSGTRNSLVWNGGTSSAWDKSTANWFNQFSSLDMFVDRDDVLFDDTCASPAVTLEQTVQPDSMVISNVAKAYSFTSSSGQGKITGAGGITKLGTGTLTVATANDFTGPVLISAGKLVAGNNAALGATNSGTTIAAGATLDVNDKSMQGELIHVQGTGVDGLGAIINSDTNNAQGARYALRNVILDGDTTFGGANRWDIRGATTTGSGTLQGANYTLTKVGGAGFYLTDGTVASVGSIAVNQGQLVVESTSGVSTNTSVIVSNGASLTMWRLNNPLACSVVLQDGGTMQASDNTFTNQNQVSGTVTLNGVGYVGGTGYNSTNYLHLSGQVTGPGQLVTTGSRTVELLNTQNNWTGGTTIRGGVLSVGNGVVDGSLADAPLTNNATLMFNSRIPQTLTAPVYGPGTWTLLGSGGVTLNGQISGSNTFNIYSNGNLTVQGTIDTTRNVTKLGDGILTLASSNSFPGAFAAGSGAPNPSGTSGGIIRLLNAYGFGDPSISKTVQVVRAELQLYGGLTLPTNLYFQTSAFSGVTGQGAGLLAIRGMSGTNTVPNTVEVYGGAGSSEYSCNAGQMVFNGPIFLGNVTTPRSAVFSGAGDGIVNGVITNGTNALTVEKNGTGTWTLTADNTYTGPTKIWQGKLVVNGSIAGSGVTVYTNGTLAGIGAINTPVTVNLGGTLAPGGAGGTLFVRSNLTLQGTAVMEIGRSSSGLFGDSVSGVATNTYGGVLVVTNIGTSPLQVNDRFQLFNAAVYKGAFANVIYPAGYTFTNNLTTDGSIQVLSVPTPPTPPSPAVLSNLSRSGGNLNLFWQGGTNQSCVLMSSTNLAQGINGWFPVATNVVGANGLSTNQLPILPDEPKRFYRLAIPYSY